MKNLVMAATLALLAGPLGQVAHAADLGGNNPEAPVNYVAERPFTWTGFYIGGRFGYGNANHNLSIDQYFKDYCGDSSQPEDHGFDDRDLDNRIDYLGADGVLTCAKFSGPEDTTPDPNFDNVVVDGQSREVASLDGLNSSGITGGGQVGFDYQIGRAVVGVFGSYDLSSMDTTASLGDLNLTLIEKGDEWSLGARAGYLLHPRVLVYALAAYTEAEWTFGDATTGEKDITFSGVTVGGGLEYALTRNIFLGLEGTHTFYGKEAVIDEYNADDNEGGRLNDEIGETKIMGTLKIKLNSDLGSGLGL